MRPLAPVSPVVPAEGESVSEGCPLRPPGCSVCEECKAEGGFGCGSKWPLSVHAMTVVVPQHVVHMQYMGPEEQWS